MKGSTTTPSGERRLSAARLLDAAGATLAVPALRRCQLALALVVATDMAHLVALATYLYREHGAAGVVAFGVVRTLVPGACVPGLAGLAARVGHGRLLRLLGVVAAVSTTAVTAVMLADGPVVAVLALAGVIGACGAAFRPIVAAVRPSLVRTPAELLACSAAAGFLNGAATLCGPLAAGLVVATAGAPAAMAGTVALLGAAALLAGRIPVIPSATPPSVLHDLVAGLRVTLRSRRVRVLGVLGLAQTGVRGALNTVLAAFVIDALGLDGGAAGILLAAMGVGGMIGLPVALRVVGRGWLFRAFGAGVVLWGLAVALVAAAPDLTVALVLFGVIGVGGTLLDISIFSALPRVVAPRELTAAFGVQEMLWQAGMALGAVGGGLLLGVLGPRGALAAAGVALLAASTLAVRALGRFDARLARHDVEVGLLGRHALFATMPVPALDVLAHRLGHAAFAPGEVIMQEGEPGDFYLLVTSGTVAVHSGETPLGVRHDGDGLGEIALVHDVPRTATAVAVTPVTGRTVDRESFLAALGQDPRARCAVDAVAAERLATLPRR